MHSLPTVTMLTPLTRSSWFRTLRALWGAVRSGGFWAVLADLEGVSRQMDEILVSLDDKASAERVADVEDRVDRLDDDKASNGDVNDVVRRVDGLDDRLADAEEGLGAVEKQVESHTELLLALNAIRRRQQEKQHAVSDGLLAIYNASADAP